MKLRIVLSLLLACAMFNAAADGPNGDAVKLTARAEAATGGAPGEIDVVIDGTVQDGWIVYASDFNRIEFGPQASRIKIDAASGQAAGALQSIGTHDGKGKNVNGDYRYTYFAKQASYRQRVKVGAEAKSVSGVVSGQACYEQTGLCTLFRQPFTVAVPGA